MRGDGNDKREGGLAGLVARWFGRFFIESSRWLLLVALVFAPWAYGSTRPAFRDSLALGLSLVAGLFVTGLILQWRWPRIHPLGIAVGIFLLLQGWVMTLVPEHFFDPATGLFFDYPHRPAWLPGTYNQADSLRSMWLWTGLFGSFCIAGDLMANPRWQRALWITMALAGFSVLMLGLAQLVTRAPAIFWNAEDPTGRTFFATFRYHANAGAFVNLVFPLLVALAWTAVRVPWSQAARAFFSVAALVACGCIVAHVSRGASLIGVTLFVGMLFVGTVAALRSGRSRLAALVGCVAALVGAVALAWAFGWDRVVGRWLANADIVNETRLLVYTAVGTRMVPEAGPWGFGPGTFHITFPFFTNDFGRALRGYWATAHNDYLQTLVEWGWIGSLGFFVLAVGGLVKGIANTTERGSDPQLRPFRVAACFSVAGVLLHSSVDFPLQIASLLLYTSVLLGVLWAPVTRPRRP